MRVWILAFHAMCARAVMRCDCGRSALSTPSKSASRRFHFALFNSFSMISATWTLMRSLSIAGLVSHLRIPYLALNNFPMLDLSFNHKLNKHSRFSQPFEWKVVLFIHSCSFYWSLAEKCANIGCDHQRWDLTQHWKCSGAVLGILS